MCLGELAAGAVSKTVSHRTVEELWLILSGKGEFYLSSFDEGPVAIEQGTSLTIPPQTKFQFRNVGNVPLKFVFTTIPAWPGPAEAVEHEHGIW
jgi:mannose-6-phosphate isomerase-like protein (cupin superfamily)